MFKKNLHYLLAILYFLILTLGITFPLILHFRDSIIGGFGDGVYFVWLIRWYQQVFLSGQGAPFFNPMMNFPEGWNLSTTDTALAAALPGTPFSALLGPIAGFNIAMWFTFVLSGFAMYFWVYHYTKSWQSALLSGTIYAFLPYRIAHFDAGHLNLSSTAWFPFYFLGLHEIFRANEKINWRYGLMCGLALGLIGLSSMYYLYFTILMTVLFVIGWFIFQNKRIFRETRFWIGVLITGLISSPFLFVALKPFLSLSAQGGLADRSLDYANQYSASPTDFLTPASSHFLFGKWISSIFDRSLWIESSLYIGSVTILLILCVIIWSKQTEHKKLISISLLLMGCAFILALGPNLHWNNQQVIVNISWLGIENASIPLPTLLLFKYLPFFSKMRAIMRIGFFTLLFAAFIAGLGSDLLMKQLRKGQKNWIGALLIALVIFDFYPGSFRDNLQKIQARPVDHWLATQTGIGAVVQMPFIKSTDQDQIFYTLTHQKPITAGFFNANQPPQFQYLAPILENFPDEKSISTLKEYRVEYILIDRKDYPQFSSLEQKLFELGLEKRTEQAGILVYGFSDAP